MKTRDKLLKWTEKWGASFNEGPKSGTGEGCAFKTDKQKMLCIIDGICENQKVLILLTYLATTFCKT